MNQIARMQSLFRPDNYHSAFRMQLLSTFLRLRLNRMISKRSTDDQNVMGFKVAHLNLKTLCTLFDEIFIEGGYYIDLGKEKPEIVDCGSNIGMSILFFKKLFPHCKIAAFEPDPETFATLSRNIALNNLNDVKAYNVAASNEEGEMSFYSDPEVSGSGMMSIMDSRAGMGKTQKVKTVRLSNYIDRKIDLLKLDVEGAEHQVFQDLNESKKLRMISNMIIEYHHHMSANSDNLAHVLGILEGNGFGYQLADEVRLPFSKNVYQVSLIYAYQK